MLAMHFNVSRHVDLSVCRWSFAQDEISLVWHHSQKY